MSSPAINPSLAYVYSAGLDGYLHKYAVRHRRRGHRRWVARALDRRRSPSRRTAPPSRSAPSGGNNYLYMGVGGYDGDGGDYQGHMTTINLNTGAQSVFNAMCSNQTCTLRRRRRTARAKVRHLGEGGPRLRPGDEPGVRRYGQRHVQSLQNYWGDTILALNPDGTGDGEAPSTATRPPTTRRYRTTTWHREHRRAHPPEQRGASNAHLALLSGKDAVSGWSTSTT